MNKEELKELISSFESLLYREGSFKPQTREESKDIFKRVLKRNGIDVDNVDLFDILYIIKTYTDLKEEERKEKLKEVLEL